MVIGPRPTVVLPRPSWFALRRHLRGRHLRGRHLRGRGLVAIGLVGTVLATAAIGIGLVALRDESADDSAYHSVDQPPAQPGPQSTPSGGAAPPANDAQQAGQQAWAHQYGQDRAAMPELPDVGSATAEQRAAAADLLARTQSATAGYADVAAAQTAGFDVQAALARAERAQPRLTQRLQQIDAGRRGAHPPVLWVLNAANTHDGKVLEPTAPQMLLYTYAGHNAWKLVGAGFIADESYPQPPPDPGGPITRWHYDARHPATLVMQVFFTAGNDLAHAYALSPA